MLLLQDASQQNGDSPEGNAMDMLQEQIGHKKEAARSDVNSGDEAARSDVKSGDACLSWDEFTIVAESAAEKLPAGKVFRGFPGFEALSTAMRNGCKVWAGIVLLI